MTGVIFCIKYMQNKDVLIYDYICASLLSWWSRGSEYWTHISHAAGHQVNCKEL